MKKNLLALIWFAVLSLMFPEILLAFGESSSNPGISAKHILETGYSTGNGVYWIDPDGPGGEPPFQAYCDMTISGGGWILALNSVTGDEPPTNDIISNTGTLSLTNGHTRNVEALAVNRDAEIMHYIRDDAGGKLFYAYYTGRYHNAMPPFNEWTTVSGHISDSDSLLSHNFGKQWSTATSDNDTWDLNCAEQYQAPWYYGSCWQSIPSKPSDGLTQGPENVPSGIIQRYAIFIREVETPNYDKKSIGLPWINLLLGDYP
jgi:hypothetical protein